MQGSWSQWNKRNTDFFREQNNDQRPSNLSSSHDMGTIQLDNPSPSHTYEVVGRVKEDKDCKDFLRLQENVAYSSVTNHH
jgi:hypothetical protein